ncbi:hypothetical protein ACKWTF_013408 [Chironomus riparius]
MTDDSFIAFCCDLFCFICVKLWIKSTKSHQDNATTIRSVVYDLSDESGMTLSENCDYYNTGPAYTPYSPSAPPFINSNSIWTEVIMSQPIRSDHEIIFGSNNPLSISTSSNSVVASENMPLTPPPNYTSLFPEILESKDFFDKREKESNTKNRTREVNQ